ncbi:unnamed protein product [marine sediment metagenome]|uniref:DDE domain-containing protein n=1 Tax=marine sediment metagenome TaxID=412755 RepID=X1F807_9ZZZZ
MKEVNAVEPYLQWKLNRKQVTMFFRNAKREQGIRFNEICTDDLPIYRKVFKSKYLKHVTGQTCHTL